MAQSRRRKGGAECRRQLANLARELAKVLLHRRKSMARQSPAATRALPRRAHRPHALLRLLRPASGAVKAVGEPVLHSLRKRPPHQPGGDGRARGDGQRHSAVLYLIGQFAGGIVGGGQRERDLAACDARSVTCLRRRMLALRDIARRRSSLVFASAAVVPPARAQPHAPNEARGPRRPRRSAGRRADAAADRSCGSWRVARAARERAPPTHRARSTSGARWRATLVGDARFSVAASGARRRRARRGPRSPRTDLRRRRPRAPARAACAAQLELRRGPGGAGAGRRHGAV